ncbi:serine/threonine-protein kinase PknD [Microbulbifer aestuariivivens]|uniref:Serine/threonine-protein kinase PknD n=1 Tax=Microbulbifer aestuariivivens TaxID=1908308 RepID=A0ABP9WJT8_9GAMM
MEVVSSGSASLAIPGYRILKKINQGGMSTVYLAVQRSVGRQVALKVMSPALNADPIFSERFQREANIVGQLSHPNIVAVHDIGRYRSLNYIAMDYMAGGSVADKLQKGPMNPIAALRVTRQIALALDHAHLKGYIHRDLKPENIIFREDGTAVLTDFGVARALARTTRMTNTGMVVGTPHYMSPEQARGASIDGRADLYSLGIVFYEMLTSTVPFQADEAVAIAIKHLNDPIPKLPPRYSLFQRLINRLLAKDPAKRFQRGQEVVDAIDQLLAALAGKRTSSQAAKPSTPSVGASSLMRALLMALWGSFLDKWATSWAQLRDKPLERSHSRTQQDTIMRIQHVIERAPQRKRRQWLATGVALSLLMLSAVLYGLTSSGFTWQWPQITGAASQADVTGKSSETTAVPFASQRNGNNNAQMATPGADFAALGTPPAKGASGENQLPDQVSRLAGTADEPDLAAGQLLTAVTANASGATTAQGQANATEEEPTPQLPRLSVKTQPSSARVRIMNIAPRYRDGMTLEPGRYDVEVSKPGYRSYRRWITLSDSDVTLQVTLKRGYAPGTTLRSRLADGGRGPEMVVVKSGRYVMGNNKRPSASPEQQIRIAEPFAISSHEITFDQYDRFAEATGAALPGDSGWGRGDRPVINVNWEDARAYARWLSSQTGKSYRLPSEAEWEYAARAGLSAPFWWGNEEAAGKANCRRGCDSEFVTLFTARSAPVGSFPANGFGLHDTAGNVAEWVEDCHQGDHSRARRDGGPVLMSNCNLRVVKGGSMRDRLSNVSADFRKGLSQKTLSTDIGFRVVMELD